MNTPTTQSTRRSRTWLALIVLALFGLASFAVVAFAAAPPAGSSIGNQATATYTDASNISRTATSNIAVTIVQQVSSFTLTADQSKFAAPGGQVYFPHTLTNTGNGTDTFTLAVVNNGGDNFDLTSPTLYADADGDGQPDDTTAIASTGALSAGAVFKFVAVGVVGGTQTAGQIATIAVQAQGTATATPAPQQTNTDTITVTSNAVIDVRKSSSALGGAPGSGPHTFTLTYTNTGNSTATDLVLTDTLPVGMTYVANSGRWSVTGATALTDALGGTQGTAPDTIVYDFGATTPRTVTATIARVQPGESRTLTFQITIDTPQNAGTLSNTAQFRYDPDGPGGTPEVGPFPTNTVNFVVSPNAGVTITGDTEPTATQGATVSFDNPVTNTGNATDSFDITIANVSFPAGTTFIPYKPGGNATLLDTNGNGIPDTGDLAPGAIYALVIKAILPPGASGAGVNYTATVTATSRNNPAVSANANDVLQNVTANTIDLTNTNPLPGAPGAGAGPEVAAVVTNATNPNATTRFTLYVNNTSGVPDSYALAASTVSTFASITLPAGWTVVFRDSGGATITDTGVIAAGGNKQVFADVTIPSQFPAGVQDIYFRAQSPTTGASDRIHDAVSVNAVRSITIAPPSNSGQAFPGGIVVYNHSLTNNGNVLEGNGVVSTITLARSDSQAGWTSVIYFDANGDGDLDATDPVVTNTSFISNGAAGLAIGESVPLLVRVAAPPGASINTLNTTTVTATTTNGTHTTPVPPVATANDATTVISGDLRLTKEQALDADNNGVIEGSYGTGNITAGARPGAAIRYRITVSNTGTSDATGVTVFDTTPAFTTYTTVAPAATTVGTVTTEPANGATGALEFNIGTLAPGASAVVTFGVVIDQ